jgi:AcrR family transcriptional regulator
MKARPALRRRQSRKQQGEQTRRAILQAAVELYAARGFRGTGLMTIGERAGVHHATVLYHFGSSRELLLAVLAERDRQFLDFTRAAFAAGGLRALANLPVVARFNLAQPVWAKLFAVLQAENLDPEAEGHDYFLERRNAFRGLVVALLADAQQRGDVRADLDAARIAETILAFSAGAQLQYFLAGGRLDLVGLYEHFTARLLADVSAPAAPRAGGGVRPAPRARRASSPPAPRSGRAAPRR